MFQEFRTQNRTHAHLVLFPIWDYVYALFFVILTIFFPKALLDASVSCHNYAKI